MQRFFINETDLTNGQVVFTGDNAQHISRSLRMKAGETVTAIIPGKNMLLCELISFTSDTVTARVVETNGILSESPCKIKVYMALSKSDKLETVVQKAVECGAYSITPFISSRCIAKAGDSFEKKLDRLNKISLEAAKQCGRGIVPEVKPILSFQQMIKEASMSEIPLFCYEAEGTEPIGKLLRHDASDISVVVGSEGGFSEDEAMLAKEQGMLLAGLGKRILRCETAPTFVLSCLSFYYELSI